MLRSDAQQQATGRDDFPFNLNNLNIEMISQIQREVDSYDIISLVFLLYKVPDTALQRLIVYQRVSKDVEGNDTNLLHDWVLHELQKTTWRNEFFEALVTCQLYSIIRKIGVDVSAVKHYYRTNSYHKSLINPMKRALYRLCENMNSRNLYRLKRTLLTYDIDVTDYETCELVLLELMCQRFITLKQLDNQTQVTKNDPGIENLAKIIQNFPDLKSFANEIRTEETGINKIKLNNSPITITPSLPMKDNNKDSHEYVEGFKEVFSLFNELNLEDIPVNLKSDTFMCQKDAYEIRNPKNVGLCLIINQEKFHPTKDSIEGNVSAKPLDDRLGSTKDKEVLQKTMKDLNFEVITRDNLDHRTMFECIQEVIKYRVQEDHSMFMLCILSHGTRGHVYAADSVKVKVEDIESLLDSDDVTHLRDKPKLLILQACQVADDSSYSPLVADSPRGNYKYYIKKSDFIIYWATAPNYEAFRHEDLGSIFIQILCLTMANCSKKDHVNDIFTKVNYGVKKICIKLERDQLPKVEHTLMKKLYLQIPEKFNG